MKKLLLIFTLLLSAPISAEQIDFSKHDHEFEGHWLLKLDMKKYLVGEIPPYFRSIVIEKDQIFLGTRYGNGLLAWHNNLLEIEIEAIPNAVKPISLKNNFETIRSGNISVLEGSSNILVSFNEGYNTGPYSSKLLESKYPASLLTSRTSILQLDQNTSPSIQKFDPTPSLKLDQRELVLYGGGLEYRFERINKEYEDMIAVVSYLAQNNRHYVSKEFKKSLIDEYNPVIGPRTCRPVNSQNLIALYQFLSALYFITYNDRSPEESFKSYVLTGHPVDLSFIASFYKSITPETIKKIRENELLGGFNFDRITVETLLKYFQPDDINLVEKIIDKHGMPISVNQLMKPMKIAFKTESYKSFRLVAQGILVGLEKEKERLWWKYFSDSNPIGTITSPLETVEDLVEFLGTGLYSPSCK